mmetsp:Transcript_27317/g.74727  ORF Transcript_27317/g.74727 Transcript_27317/m.74727 type:complete len:265 (+) Transcript_27317:552-1346(+)
MSCHAISFLSLGRHQPLGLFHLARRNLRQILGHGRRANVGVRIQILFRFGIPFGVAEFQEVLELGPQVLHVGQHIVPQQVRNGLLRLGRRASPEIEIGPVRIVVVNVVPVLVEGLFEIDLVVGRCAENVQGPGHGVGRKLVAAAAAAAAFGFGFAAGAHQGPDLSQLGVDFENGNQQRRVKVDAAPVSGVARLQLSVVLDGVLFGLFPDAELFQDRVGQRVGLEELVAGLGGGGRERNRCRGGNRSERRTKKAAAGVRRRWRRR